ncbi:S-layer homology domain-containing protein [Cohnella fermenti]|uniref:SLH domain-containing protein n=1 Tax=Cohnella fermenti TaxID=2565925 RepID=A0A4S4BI89_9BACL|nr:S-layer homology domain-containing protein [Cohnella fermenti]THF74318.1 hypothetical protein E6C55_25810 [Cohnella fermenti]
MRGTNRFKCLGLAIVLAVSLCTGFLKPAFAEDSTQVVLSSTVSSIAVGSELNVAISGLQLKDVYAYEINLTYDSTKLQFVKAVSEVSGGFTVSPIVNGNQLQLAYTAIGAKPGVNGDLALFTLTFKGVASGSADIELGAITLVDSSLHSSEATVGPRTTISIVNSAGNGGPDTNIPSTPPAPALDNVTNDGKGTLAVELAPGATEAHIAMNQLGSDPGARLTITNRNLSVDIPPEVLQQLREQLSAEQLTNSTLVFGMNPLSSGDAGSLIDRLQQFGSVGLKPSGSIYELSLQLTTGDNRTIALESFNKPIMLRFAADPSLNVKRISIYYIPNDDTLEFVGGTYADGEITADIDRPGKYAALEYIKSFKDVPDDNWAKDAITELAARHIVEGTSATNFEPKRTVTRAEFAALLVRALHLTDKQDLHFTDVSASDWFFPEVSIAVKAGIVTGTNETTFAPQASITREEMVTMLMRAYLLQRTDDDELPSAPAFQDEDTVSPWALSYVRDARALHFIEGKGANLFMPQGVGTRAEAAQIIYNFLS